jgi:hypothetical protein
MSRIRPVVDHVAKMLDPLAANHMLRRPANGGLPEESQVDQPGASLLHVPMQKWLLIQWFSTLAGIARVLILHGKFDA